MRRLNILYPSLFALFILAACSTGFHGSFSPNTYFSDEDSSHSENIGPAKGQSCQTKVLYLFPLGPAPSTAKAIQAAKDQNQETKYLTDVSIDDRTEWGIGYSKQCITVEGFAHQ